MPTNGHFNTVRNTGSNKNMMQHAGGGEDIHIEENGGQLTV
jgi:hypothetical protein